jgi:hypothetical protein
MVTFDQMVVVARIARGLLAGRDGEDVVADVRTAPVIDAAPIVRSIVLTVVLACVAVGLTRAAGKGTAALV